MTDPPPIKRRARALYVLQAVPLIGLLAVLMALAAGASRARLLPVAGFLLASSGSVAFNILARSAHRRRAYQRQQLPLPRQVCHRAPWWMALEMLLTGLSLTSLVGAIAAVLGFPGVGLGFTLGLTGLTGLGGLAFGDVQGLTFEDAGLRVHARSRQWLIPWACVREITPIGPAAFQMIQVELTDVDRVIDSVRPDTPKNRERVARVLRGATPTRTILTLWPGVAGLDGPSLERALRESRDGIPDQAN